MRLYGLYFIEQNSYVDCIRRKKMRVRFYSFKEFEILHALGYDFFKRPVRVRLNFMFDNYYQEKMSRAPFKNILSIDTIEKSIAESQIIIIIINV